MPGGQGGVEESPITDIMAYNQSLPRREEDVVTLNDLLLSFRLVKISGRGTLFVRAIAGKDVFQIEISPDTGAYRAIHNGRELLQEDGQLSPKMNNLDVVVSLIDRQFLLAFNNKTVLCLLINDPDSKSESTSRPFAIGTLGLGVTLADLRIFRDVYYIQPIGWLNQAAFNKPVLLGEEEYFVLGDNSPIAEDSRTWPEHAQVIDNLFIGKPLVLIYPAKSIGMGSWQFQVPDLSRIGYIR